MLITKKGLSACTFCIHLRNWVNYDVFVRLMVKVTHSCSQNRRVSVLNFPRLRVVVHHTAISRGERSVRGVQIIIVKTRHVAACINGVRQRFLMIFEIIICN